MHIKPQELHWNKIKVLFKPKDQIFQTMQRVLWIGHLHRRDVRVHVTLKRRESKDKFAF